MKRTSAVLASTHAVSPVSISGTFTTPELCGRARARRPSGRGTARAYVGRRGRSDQGVAKCRRPATRCAAPPPDDGDDLVAHTGEGEARRTGARDEDGAHLPDRPGEAGGGGGPPRRQHRHA